MAHRRQHVVKCTIVAGHLQTNIKTFLHPQRLHHFRETLAPNIAGDRRPQPFSEFQSVWINISDYYMARPSMFRDRDRHYSDRTRAGNQHIFTEYIKRERGVDRISQRIETGEHIESDLRIRRPGIGSRKRDVLSESARSIHADAAGLVAKMPPASQTVSTTATDEVALSSNNHAGMEIMYMTADRFDDSDKLVSDHHRSRNRFLSPTVPFVNMAIGSTDRRAKHPDQPVEFANVGNRYGIQAQTGSAILFDQRLHFLRHNQLR